MDRLEEYLQKIKKDYSLILPSRGRIPYLRKFLDSVVVTTQRPERIDIYIALDFDDDLAGYFVMLAEFPMLDKKIIVRTRDIDISEQYYNMLARMVKGEYIWGFNDDCEIRTKNWDTILDDKIKNIPYKIFVLKTYGPGISTMNSLSAFIVIPKIVTDGLGYLIFPGIFTHTADHYLSNLWNGAGRFIETPELYVAHMNNSPDGLRDDTQIHMREGYDKSVVNGHSFPFYPQELEKIKKLIEKYEGVK